MIRYDADKKSKAERAALFRAVVAGYIGYLGYKIACAEDTTMSVTLSRVLGIAFIAAAAGFAVYIVKRWRSDMENARITEDTGTDESDAP